MKCPLHTRNRGYVLLVTLIASGLMLITFSTLVNYVSQYAKSTRHVIASSQAQALAEAGIEKAIYELNQNDGYTGESDTVLGDGTFSISVTAVDGSTKRITATGYIPNSTNPRAQKTVKAQAGINASTVSFQFGVQAGDGGVNLQNSSSIRGNLYSTGPVTGQNSNIVRGDVISAGPTGLINSIHATSSGYAHIIQNSTLDKDAYYQTISGTTVGRTSYPGSPDQATSSLPISDAQIEEWKTAAAAGGIYTSPCPYTITSSVTIGPKKINCSLSIEGSPTITLAGPLWVSGNVEIENSATIRVQSSLGNNSIPIIADNPNDQLNSSKVELENNVTIQGSGSPGSYVLFVSQNRSAEAGGPNVAIDVKNSASGALLIYAGHGQVVLQNSVAIKEVSAWKISVKNSAQVIYETGLVNTLFSSGPGGSWAFLPGTYVIVQ